MIPEIKFSFTMMSKNIEPELIAEKLGIQPTQSHKIGDKKQLVQGEYDSHFWQLSTGYQESYDLNDQINVRQSNTSNLP